MGAVVSMQPDQVNGEEYSTDLFAEFWELYPRHIAKLKAERAWRRLPYRDRLEALSALVHWRKLWLWRDELQYTPYPASWLNGERWTDELPREFMQKHASHVAVTIKPEEFKRGEMPEHVKEALAKLREKR